MKEIKLTRGKVALVDDDDFDGLSKFNWHTQKGRHTFYAARNCWIIGLFTSEDGAAAAYNQKAKELYGEFANLNIL